MMPGDHHPLFFLQMKKGPVDKIVIGRSGAKVLLAIIAVAGVAMIGARGGEVEVNLMMLRVLLAAVTRALVWALPV